MTGKVTPNAKRPPYHVNLYRGADELGLVLCNGNGEANERAYTRDPIPQLALKIYSGEEQNSSMEPPWQVVDQRNYASGRGSENLADDASRYYDGWRVDTTLPEQVIIGGQDFYTLGYKGAAQFWPWRDGSGGVHWASFVLNDYYKYIAYKFKPASSFGVELLLASVRRHGTPNVLHMEIRSDASGTPGAVVWDADIAVSKVPEEGVWTLVKGTSEPVTLSASNFYWMTLWAASPPAGTYWEIQTASGGQSALSTEGSAWVNPGLEAAPIWRASEGGRYAKAIFFEYKRQLMAVMTYEDGAQSQIFENGDAGVATAGSTTVLNDASKTWATNIHQGAIAWLRAGPGSDQPSPFSTIVENTSNELHLSPALKVAPGAGSEYVIISSDYWKEVTGHGIVGSVTDVLVVNNLAYFAVGDGTPIRRMRRHNNAGTWTTTWAAETGNGYYLAAVVQAGEMEIWKGKRATPDIAKAPAVAEDGAALTWGTDVSVGDRGERISGLEVYGESPHLWVLKEGSLYEIVSDKPNRLPVYEMASVSDPRNGVAHLAHNVYLYFSLLDGLERYIGNNLDDMGPNRGPGLPADRQGAISHLVGYPGRVIAAVDAGADGYSSVLLHNGMGWHELYRSPLVGQRIRRMHIQSLPGQGPDRLWISVGADLVWIPLAMHPYTLPVLPYQFYPYAHEAHLITSWHWLGLRDVVKYFQSLKLITEGLSMVGGQQVYVDYQVDNEPWRSLAGSFSVSFSEEWPIGNNDTDGRRLRLRLRLVTHENTLTPRILATVIEAVTRLPQKFANRLTFRVADQDHDLNGIPDPRNLTEKLEQLTTWASEALPVNVEAVSRELHGALAFVNRGSIRPVAMTTREGKQVMVCEVTLIEL